MHDKTHAALKKLEARVTELEDFSNELSGYIAELEQDSREKHDNLVSLVNAFFKDVMSKFEDIDEYEDDA